MAKTKTRWVCQSCAHESVKWLGKCPSCEAWNSLEEEIVAPKISPLKKAGYGNAASSGVVRLSEISDEKLIRIPSGSAELDRVLGGGFVPGGVCMLGGDPGIGKSTISLQIVGALAKQNLDPMVISGEESLGQIKLRAQRLGVENDGWKLANETSLERIESLLREHKPPLVVIDSIQTVATQKLTSTPGSVSQLREVTGTLTQLAKGLGIAIVLIGHVTKQGSIAGPKVLEHMVDTVLYFEAPSGQTFRVLRAVKNRFGSTNEVGVFMMGDDGLRDVENPSALFLEGRPKDEPGSVVVPIVEGTRPFLVEVQSLVNTSGYGPAKITTVGVERDRVLLILSILERRLGLQLTGMDVFVNVTGGVRIQEPAADVGVALAIISSLRNKAVPSDLIAFGELGLTGEIRGVSRPEARVSEANGLGFSHLIIPERGTAAVKSTARLQRVRSLEELVDIIFI